MNVFTLNIQYRYIDAFCKGFKLQNFSVHQTLSRERCEDKGANINNFYILLENICEC